MECHAAFADDLCALNVHVDTPHPFFTNNSPCPTGIVQPLTLWDNPAMHIYLRGKSGPGYERPWKSANADNPLAQWAEKKKEEAAMADAKKQ